MLMEQELDAQLVDRGRSPFTLTPAGELYLDSARRILEIKNSLFRKVKPEPPANDVLLVKAAPMYVSTVLSHLLSRFKADYPQMAFRLEETLLPVTPDAADAEESGTLRICGLPIPEDLYDCQPLFTERILLVMASSHPEARRIREKATPNLSDPSLPGLNLGLLRDFDFVAPQTSVRLQNITREMCGKAGFEPRLHEANSMLYSILTLLPTTGQVALVPETAYNYPNYYNPQLCYFTAENPRFERTMVVAYKKGKELSPLERLFIIKSREYLNG